MRMKDCILMLFHKCFYGCFMPCNELIVSLIGTHLCCDSEVVSRNDNAIVIKLNFEDEPIVVKCDLTSNGKSLYISNISVVE